MSDKQQDQPEYVVPDMAKVDPRILMTRSRFSVIGFRRKPKRDRAQTKPRHGVAKAMYHVQRRVSDVTPWRTICATTDENRAREALREAPRRFPGQELRLASL